MDQAERKTLRASHSKQKRRRQEQEIKKIEGNQIEENTTGKFGVGKTMPQQGLQINSQSFSRTRCTVFNQGKPNKRNQSNQMVEVKHEKKEIKMIRNTKKQDKISKMRQVLPNYYNANMPQNFANLQRLMDKLDKYLHKLPRKQVGESFVNLRTYLEKNFAMQLAQHQILQMNYVMPGCYNYYDDPLHNLVIEFPRGESIYLRQKNFRKNLYDIYLEFAKNGKQNDMVPTKPIKPRKIQYFYPPKKYRKQQKGQTSKVSSQFVNHLLDQVKAQQAEQQHQMSMVDYLPTVTSQMIDDIRQITMSTYAERKVFNIFKITLLSIIHQKTGLHFGLIKKGLQMLCQDESSQLQEIMLNNRIIVQYQRSEQQMKQQESL